MNFEEITYKLSNRSLLEKTEKHVSKLELLIKKLTKQYHTRLNFPDASESEFNAEFFKSYKQMSYLLYIVVIEISHSLEDLGLHFYHSPIVTLFQFFKYSSIVFMKSNISFYHQLIAIKESETLAEER